MSREAQRKLLASLGLPEDGIIEMRKGEPSEPVNKDMIREFYRGNLNTGDAINVSYLLSHEEAWFNVGNEVLLEHEHTEAAGKNTTLASPDSWMHLHHRQILFGIAASLLFAVGSFLWLATQNNEFNDGQNLVAIRDGIVTGLDKYGPEWTSMAHSALIDNQLPNPENAQELTAGLRPKRGMPLSKAIVAPYLTVVREPSPLLRWHVVGNPLAYRVVVKDAQTLELASSDNIKPDSTAVKVPIKLARGRMYVWEVFYRYADDEMKAPKTGVAPARFLVLSAESFRRLEADESIIGDSMFLRFLLYVREGLFDEAEVMLEKLASANNDSIYLDTLSNLLRKKRAALFEEQNDEDVTTGQP